MRERRCTFREGLQLVTLPDIEVAQMPEHCVSGGMGQQTDGGTGVRSKWPGWHIEGKDTSRVPSGGRARSCAHDARFNVTRLLN